MEPQIRYARTSDGLSIAYYAMGSGQALIVIPAGLHQSIQFEARLSNFSAAADASARAFRYVRYDPRGSGLSDRDVDDFSLEAMARDVVSVADAIGADEFMLFAGGSLSMVGVWLAAHQPERVKRLVLWASSTRGDEFDNSAMRVALESAEADWRLASEAMIQAVDRWDNPDLAHEHAAAMRASVEPATWVRWRLAIRGWDVAALLPDVKCPTLVIHPASNPYAPVARARRVAAAIPGARLAVVETASLLMPDAEVVRASGLFFLGRDAGRSSPPAESPHGTAIILFVDIADSTALTERVGDAAFRAEARELDRALRAVVREHGGTAIDAKTLGDGILATFPAASQALAAALGCRATGETQGLPLHLGLHAGDVIREEGNVFGGAVTIAARICALSAAGEVIVSATVRDLARTSSDVTFADRGEHVLKGVADPVQIFAVAARPRH